MSSPSSERPRLDDAELRLRARELREELGTTCDRIGGVQRWYSRIRESYDADSADRAFAYYALAMASLEDHGPAPIKVLFMSSDPVNADRLRLGAEHRDIQQRLDAAQHGDRFLVSESLATRVSDIQRALLRHQPSIVHFSGHGSRSGLCFESPAGDAQLVTGSALRDLFATVGGVRCVVMNSCYSTEQATAIGEVVDFVIGMTDTIGDQAAIAFAAAFYQGLAFGQSVGDSFQLGCNQIDLEGLQEAHCPQLNAAQADAYTFCFVGS